MILRILVLAIIPCLISATTEVSNSYDGDVNTKRRRFAKTTDVEFEPVNPLSKYKNQLEVAMKNLNCEDFTPYTLNCTLEAAQLYNSNRKTAPMPAKINDWCKAIRHLTNCAIDWNSECRELTESHFNEESIKGHMHVIDNICDDDWFLSRYDDIPMCIEATADVWEACYSTFKILVDEQKNKTREWTHYETHFYMCCAKAGFRRCTLDAVFGNEACDHGQATTLQKFSVIISEGDVFQDCDANIMYANCPGGDPRPTKQHLSKLMATDAARSNVIRTRSGVVVALALLCFSICILLEFKRF